MGKTDKPKKAYKDKHDAFVCVVTPRLNKAIKAIELLRNQAGAAYAPTKAEVAEMFATIRAKVDETELFYKGEGKQVAGFSFSKK